MTPRHEIMVKRTRQEIEEIAAEMIKAWRGARFDPRDADPKSAGMARAKNLIFMCLDGAVDDYRNADG